MTNRFWSSRTFIFLAGHFQTLTNSDLRPQTSDSEYEQERGIREFVLRHSFVIRLPRRSLGEGGSFACQAVALAKGWCFFIQSMSFAASPRFRSSDGPNDVTL